VLIGVIDGGAVFSRGDANVIGIHSDVAPGVDTAAGDRGVVACLDSHILTGIKTAAPSLIGNALVRGGGRGLPEEGAAAGADVVHGVHGFHRTAGITHGVVTAAQVTDGIGRIAEVVVQGQG